MAGRRVRVQICGSGPPLLVLNGLGAALEMLAPLREAIDGRRIVTFDVPGVGESEAWLRPSMRTYASFVGEVMDCLEVAAADIVGMSWGGVLAQAFAVTSPQRLGKLVLLATGSGATNIPGSLTAPLVLTTPVRYLSPKFLDRSAGRLYGGDVRSRPDRWRHLGELWTAHPPSIAGYWSQLVAVSSWSSFPWLRSIPHPTLIMAGADDPISHPVNARLMARLIRRAEVEILPDAGHLFMITRPTETAERIERFLNAGTGHGGSEQ